MSEKEFESYSEKILHGLSMAYEKMVKFKRMKDSKIIVSQNGKIVRLDPHKIRISTDL